MSDKLRGKVAIVTGASSGIGEAAARALAAEGAHVVVAARRAERLAALVSDIEESGGTALAVPTDVTKRESVEALVR
ncbi:MAG: SDR family NAD(P)-dependent oxidoreductase, partial [Acidobacteria bacterium]|nr:SDR family NAD(P)-dependent oxidoreductase [Acidobacteriota bacterium]